MNEPRLNLPELTVSELSAALKRTIEDAYGYVRVRGELGKVSYHGNGHVYFDLKDDRACIAGVIWRSTAPRIKLKLEAGLEVVITGRLTTYPGRSQYQIVVETLEPAGLGALMALLEERKTPADRRGPVRRGAQAAAAVLPAVIGVITSPTGAVIRDILHRLADRFPAPRAGLAGQGAGRGLGRRVAAAIAGFNALPERGTAVAAAARSPHRRARRRLARGFVVVQRGDRGARGGGEPHSADLRGRPRDRRDADRFCRRPPRADADRRRRNGGAGARRADGRRRFAGAARARLVAAQSGGAAQRIAFGSARALPNADEVLALPRQRLDHAAARTSRARLRANAHIHRVSFRASAAG
jgi:exodeoxyribonuclease VII large subunit